MMKNQNIIGFTSEVTGRCIECNEPLTKIELDEFGINCYACDAMPDKWLNDFSNINEPYGDIERL